MSTLSIYQQDPYYPISPTMNHLEGAVAAEEGRCNPQFLVPLVEVEEVVGVGHNFAKTSVVDDLEQLLLPIDMVAALVEGNSHPMKKKNWFEYCHFREVAVGCFLRVAGAEVRHLGEVSCPNLMNLEGVAVHTLNLYREMNFYLNVYNLK